MTELSTIGIDLAKRVFQVHGVDRVHKVVVQKQLSRSEVVAWFSKQVPCLVGMEACATSNYWAQEISKLGHRVKLIPPAYVKPYVRRQKNDRADAAAICEAVSRPSMRFVEIKTKDQQAIQVLHRAREVLIQQLTQTGNALRAHLAEFGWIYPKGNMGLSQAVNTAQDTKNNDIPTVAQEAMFSLIEQLKTLKSKRSRSWISICGPGINPILTVKDWQRYPTSTLSPPPPLLGALAPVSNSSQAASFLRG
jgi:transposase